MYLFRAEVAPLLSVAIRAVRSVPLEIKTTPAGNPTIVQTLPTRCKGESVPSPLLSVVMETAMVTAGVALSPRGVGWYLCRNDNPQWRIAPAVAGRTANYHSGPVLRQVVLCPSRLFQVHVSSRLSFTGDSGQTSLGCLALASAPSAIDMEGLVAWNDEHRAGRHVALRDFVG